MTTANNTSIFGYNGEGFRTIKTVNGKTTNCLYEGDRVILETDENNNQKAKNVYGTNLLARTDAGETYYYMYNGHADVTALIDTKGNIGATYYYDAFGNPTETVESAVYSPTRFAGYQYDKETGLYYL